MTPLGRMRQLGHTALGFCLDAIRTGGTPPLVVLLDEPPVEPVTTPGPIAHHVLHGYEGPAGLAAARNLVGSRPATTVAYAIVFGEGDTRLVTEVGVRDSARALRLAQDYRPFRSLAEPLCALGEPILLGDVDNALGDDVDDTAPPALSLIAVCPACNRKNRIGLGAIRTALPRCGACKAKLAAAR